MSERVFLFSLLNYRQAFHRLFQREKELRGSTWSLSLLAQKVGLQPSYLTNVTKERAHFSSDQVYAVSAALGLNMAETEYLDLLMQHERAMNPQRRRRIEALLERLRQKNFRVEKVISSPQSQLREEARDRYYLDPFVELIHLYLGTRNAFTDLGEIARLWGIPERRLAEIASFLQKEGLVRIQDGKWSREKVSQHLPRESFLTQASLQLKRMLALDRLQKLPEGAAYSFGATVTITEETRLEIQSLFLKFLDSAEKAVRASRPDGVYQIQFDLFPWVYK